MGSLFSSESSEEKQQKQEMALEKAKQIVSANPVAVFSKSYCPFCKQAKNLLSSLGANYKAVELDQESDGQAVQDALYQWTGQRTVPNVFIGGKHIGGCDSTVALHNQGKLVPLLNEAGALQATTHTAYKSYWPFCKQVKNLLSLLGANYKAVELDQESDGQAIQDALHQWTGQRTVPNVFIGGKHIGGCDNTVALHNQGKLVPLLNEAGALQTTQTA